LGCGVWRDGARRCGLFALRLVRHAPLLAVIHLGVDREIWCEGLAFLQNLGMI
jgi:hypothetical protein